MKTRKATVSRFISGTVLSVSAAPLMFTVPSSLRQTVAEASQHSWRQSVAVEVQPLAVA